MSDIKEINGVKVVGSKPATTALGHPMKQVDELTMEDGSKMYGCAHDGCDAVGTSYQKLLHHLRVHDPRPPRKWMKVADMSVADVLNTIVEYQAIIDRLNKELKDAKSKASDRLFEIRALEGRLNRREVRIAADGYSHDKEIQKLTKERDEALRIAEDALAEADKWKNNVAILREVFGNTTNGG